MLWSYWIIKNKEIENNNKQVGNNISKIKQALQQKEKNIIAV